MIWTLIAITASILTAIQLIPQAVKAIRSKELSGVSLSAFSMITLTASLWLAYGIHLGDWAIIFANFITLLCSGTIVIVKLKKR